ncbi:MAG: hypothetical protein GX220_06165 [Treponema sp.]|jgi:hypothetical protein|nr:hypothetical protein [Treponema sp.]
MLAKLTKKDKPFIYSLILILVGFLLPLVIGLFATIFESSHIFFLQILYSNCAVATIFCLPISIGIIYLSIPLYEHLVNQKTKITPLYKNKQKIQSCGIVNAEKETKVA